MSFNLRVSIFLTVFAFMSTGIRADGSVCRNVLKSYLDRHAADEFDYDWTTAIFLYGAERFAQKYDAEALKRIEFVYESLAKRIPSVTNPDLAALSLPAALSESDSRKKIIAASEEYFSTAKKNSLGVLNHVGGIYPESVWADSLIMYVLGRKAEEDGLTILKNLQDGPLFYHAYYPTLGWKFPLRFHWARGNLWIALYLSEMLSQKEIYRELLGKQLAELMKYYVKGKGLRTLLDDPTSEFESSSTALLGYVLKRMNHDQDQEVSKTILSFVKEGKFTGTSGPTTAFPLPVYYRSLIPMGEYPYGVGVFLLWCSEP